MKPIREKCHSDREKTTKKRGQMTPFTRDDLQLIRATLRNNRSVRDIALLNVAVDTLLRSSDLLRLRVDNVRAHVGAPIKTSIPLEQKKTRQAVIAHLGKNAVASIEALIEDEDKYQGDYLFTPTGKPHDAHLTEGMFRLLVKDWARYAHKDDVSVYSGHSLRRTKAAFVYEETKNLEAVRQMLGHTSLAQTIKYLGVTEKQVADIAAKYEM